MKRSIIIILTVTLTIFLSWTGLRIVNYIIFDRDCQAHLKRAANASTIELANSELTTALRYMGRKNLTAGYTSIIYNTPDEDLGFWYSNIKASKQELEKLPQSATALEKTNILMKLRETLLDNEMDGDAVIVPSGASIYPHNILYFWVCLILVLLLSYFMILFLISLLNE